MPAPSLRVVPTQVESEIHAKTNGSINHGVSANARAIITDVISTIVTAICHASALRIDIIGPASARSHTITAPSELLTWQLASTPTATVTIVEMRKAVRIFRGWEQVRVQPAFRVDRARQVAVGGRTVAL